MDLVSFGSMSKAGRKTSMWSYIQSALDQEGKSGWSMKSIGRPLLWWHCSGALVQCFYRETPRCKAIIADSRVTTLNHNL